MNFDNHAQPNYPSYNDAYCLHVTHGQDDQNHRNVTYQPTNCDLLLCELQQSSSIRKAASVQEECSRVTAEFQACEATFLSRAETTMNSDTTPQIRTFHALRSKQMSERLHKEEQGQNLTAEMTEDLENKQQGSICYPGDESKTQGISKPRDNNIVTSKPPNFGEVNKIAVLDNVDNLSCPQDESISEPCQSLRESLMSEEVVQTTNKENEIQCYSWKENLVVQVEEIFSDVHLEDVFPVLSISISKHVMEDKQNIQHGSISSEISTAIEPVCTRNKTDAQEFVVFNLIEPEIIFKIVESQDNRIAVVNSHFAFQEPIVSYHLSNIESCSNCQKGRKQTVQRPTSGTVSIHTECL